MEAAERAIYSSIKDNAADPDRVEIHFMKAHGTDPFWNGWMNSPRPSEINKPGMWVTPFSLFRYAVPAINRFDGYAIYLDVDMVVLKDIAELYEFRREGKWSVAVNQDGDCVAVIDCSCVLGDHEWPTVQDLKRGFVDKHRMRAIASKYYVKWIPERWNHHDRCLPNTALIHFTDVSSQPWQPYPDRINYKDHPCQESCAWFRRYANEPI